MTKIADKVDKMREEVSKMVGKERRHKKSLAKSMTKALRATAESLK